MKQLIDFSRHEVARVHLQQLIPVVCIMSHAEKFLDEALCYCTELKSTHQTEHEEVVSG